MSAENPELVRQLQPAPGVDLTEVFMRGDDEGARGKIARAEFFADRARALEAAGLRQ